MQSMIVYFPHNFYNTDCRTWEYTILQKFTKTMHQSALILNPKVQKLPGSGGVHPLPPPLHIFPRFLARRVMCLMHPLEYKKDVKL